MPISYLKSGLKREDEIEKEEGRQKEREISVLWKEYTSARTIAVPGQTKNEGNETHMGEMEENTRGETEEEKEKNGVEERWAEERRGKTTRQT